MLFDFKTNRIIFFVGLIILLVLTSTLLVVFEWQFFSVIALSLAFVFLMSILMKRHAGNMYRYVHQLLFIRADAKAYLKEVEILYHRSKKGRKLFVGVKMQNLNMAALFAGDLARAKAIHEEFIKSFGGDLVNQPSMRFSQAMVETLLSLFIYDKETLEIAYEKLQEQLQTIKPVNREYVENNPYSVFYMLSRVKDYLEMDTIDLETLNKELKESNEFLKSCILYALLKNNKVTNADIQEIELTTDNTMFYLDEEKILETL